MHWLTCSEPPPVLPEGLAYRPDLVPKRGNGADRRDGGAGAEALRVSGLPGQPADLLFGFLLCSTAAASQAAEPIPVSSAAARTRGRMAGLEAEALQHALLIEYGARRRVGWHRDRPVFGDVIGISLLAPAPLRFRRRTRRKMGAFHPEAAPRSAYLLKGPARSNGSTASRPGGDVALCGDVSDIEMILPVPGRGTADEVGGGGAGNKSGAAPPPRYAWSPSPYRGGMAPLREGIARLRDV